MSLHFGVFIPLRGTLRSAPRNYPLSTLGRAVAKGLAFLMFPPQSRFGPHLKSGAISNPDFALSAVSANRVLRTSRTPDFAV